MNRFGLVLVASLMLSGCMHVEISAESEKLDKSKPHVTRQLPYWWGGFGVQHVHVVEACKGKGKFSQFQLKQRFLDGFLQIVTFGIYSPMTANVTCNGK